VKGKKMPVQNEILDAIFVELFSVQPADAAKCTMGETEAWDSFSHISLMLRLEEILDNKEIPMEIIPELISYEKCYNFLAESRSR
jgi:acyl carrier protein